MSWIAFPIQVNLLDTEASVQMDKTQVKKGDENQARGRRSHVPAQNKFINVRQADRCN